MTKLADKIEADVIHFISADPAGHGNVTACGLKQHYPLRGNGWRVRDITCPECDTVICDMAHAALRAREANR